MKLRILFTIIVSLSIISSCKESEKKSISGTSSIPTKTIYYNGDIVTMEGDKPEYAETVVEEYGKIIFTGNKEDAFEKYGEEINTFNLEGNTLMPGFIEPHAHPVSIGAFILANEIVAPHEWRMPHKTFKAVSGNENYLKAVKEIIENKNDTEETVLIWGYHKAWHGTLTLQDLDKMTGATPTIIWQRSTHEIYINTACAEKYNISKGDVKEVAQVDWENFHFWELAYQEIKNTKLKSFFSNQEMLKLGMERITPMMLSKGLIAMTEPGFPLSTFETEYEILKAETEKAQSYSIYLIPGFPEQFVKGMSNESYKERIDSFPNYNTDYIKFMPKQYKSFADGAIYSLALQLKDEFFGCPNCHAEWIIPPAQGKELFDYWWDAEYKVHIHITGDLAFDAYLDIVETAQNRNPRENHRTTFHHIGLFSAEQAQRAAELGIEASANPYYLWALADKYSEIGFGPERAANMVAMKELTDRDIPLSLHSDFAMAPAEPLLLAWVAANRIVASGKTMNPILKISVFEAMKGVTISAARTFEMENEIGSIKVGKEASFTILEENPFEIEPIKLKDIAIDGIVYKGKYINNTEQRKN